MKKLKLVIMITVVMSTIGFVSCDIVRYQDIGPSEFIVVEILPRNGMKSMTTYKVEILDVSGVGELNNNSPNFWVVDSIGKYKVGDKLLLQKVTVIKK